VLRKAYNTRKFVVNTNNLLIFLILHTKTHTKEFKAEVKKFTDSVREANQGWLAEKRVSDDEKRDIVLCSATCEALEKKTQESGSSWVMYLFILVVVVGVIAALLARRTPQ